MKDKDVNNLIKFTLKTTDIELVEKEEEFTLPSNDIFFERTSGIVEGVISTCQDGIIQGVYLEFDKNSLLILLFKFSDKERVETVDPRIQSFLRKVKRGDKYNSIEKYYDQYSTVIEKFENFIDRQVDE